MSAEVSGREIIAEALTPSTLELIGRSLIRRGQVVFLIVTEGGRLALLPAETPRRDRTTTTGPMDVQANRWRAKSDHDV